MFFELGYDGKVGVVVIDESLIVVFEIIIIILIDDWVEFCFYLGEYIVCGNMYCYSC